MITILHGDFSKYPDAIKETFPSVAGETIALHQHWSIYERLFMLHPEFTSILHHRFGPLLGVFQTMLQDEMLLSIARLTDKDNPQQKNLTIWCLREAIPFAKDPNFAGKVHLSFAAIAAEAGKIRKHRHKRLAHFDREISLRKVPDLAKVTLKEISTVIAMIEAHLNLFFWEFERSEMLFDRVHGYDFTEATEISAFKAQAYDLLELAGAIPQDEWKKQRMAVAEKIK